MDQPYEVLGIYENTDESHLDKYTITVLFEDGDSFIIGSSERPFHPQGFFNMSEGYLNGDEWLEENRNEKEIYWESLPEDVKKAVVQHLELCN